MRISDWSSDVCSSDLVEEERYELSANRYEIGASSAYKFDPRNYVVGSARYENDAFSPYDYQATASAGYGHKFIENERTRLSTEVGTGFPRSRASETAAVVNGVRVRSRVDFNHQHTTNHPN